MSFEFEVLKPTKEELKNKGKVKVETAEHAATANCGSCSRCVPRTVKLYGDHVFFRRWDEHVSREGGDILIDRVLMADHLTRIIERYKDPLAVMALEIYMRGNFVEILNRMPRKR